EWDCIFRVHKNDSNAQKMYLDFLRNLLKDKSYVALAYMTGILPIKKYGEHSALNMFKEFSMTNQKSLAEFAGFTDDEVTNLCERYNMSYEEMKKWYDGYTINGFSIYNPKSVVEALTEKIFDNYWSQTETYHALSDYIRMNYDGLKEKIIQMLACDSVKINPGKFQNDMTTFNSADDVLTLLVHLGYLTFDFDTKMVSIPNSEVQQEFINSIEDGGWENIVKSIHNSEELLNSTLAMDEEKVAKLIEQAHQDNTSILRYNDENSLSCVVSIAYYSARKNYVMYREMPAGKGFADLVFIPRKSCNLPAFIVELKQQKSSEKAIKQIFTKNYTDALKDYKGEVLLVGINYDSDKHHTCRIEKVVI
ncbi:MAG: AAA family ATPase, partial [Oscillospiraceae bacterium]|nr:AAA family ATPase [Oscillospiraceae bacterium]